MSRDTDSDTTRRTMLRAIGASAAAVSAAGFAANSVSATPAASREMRRLEAAYRDPLRARWAVVQHAGPVLAELADRGVLERGTVDELDFDRLDVRGLYVDGETTAQIVVRTETATGPLEIHVRPELGFARGTIKDAGDGPLTVESDAKDDDVSTQVCWTESSCTAECDFNTADCAYLERRCCNPCIQSVDGPSTANCETSCDSWSQEGCCSC